jgi:hypothetical protein
VPIGICSLQEQYRFPIFSSKAFENMGKPFQIPNERTFMSFLSHPLKNRPSRFFRVGAYRDLNPI